MLNSFTKTITYYTIELQLPLEMISIFLKNFNFIEEDKGLSFHKPEKQNKADGKVSTHVNQFRVT